MIFFKTKKSHKDFSAVATDMHSHLVPAVDDGALDVADSLRMISGLADLGFQKIYTTPHSMQGIHPNTRSSLSDAFNTLNGGLAPAIPVELSSEYYLDEHFQELLNSDQLLPLPGNRLLIEFSQITKPYNLEEQLFDLAVKGYQIILAHPERYLFWHKNFNYFSRLKDMGIEFQVNALSLSNHYGKNIRAVAEKLIDHKMIDFIGTDIHRVEHLELLREIPDTKYYGKLLDSGMLKNGELSKFM